MSASALSEELHGLLDRTGALLSDLCDGRAAGATDAAVPGLFQAFASLKARAEADQTTIGIIALAKSGKSTLINALLSEQLLPSNNVPETSRIVALEHSAAAAAGAPPRLSYAAADGSLVSVEGASAIREHLRELNAAARESGSSSGSGSSGSLLAREAPLDVQVSFTALSSCPELGGRLCVLDTPGPNEDGQEALRHKVDRLLESVDAVVHVLDYTKLKTSEEAAMLRRLRELNPALIRRLAHRLFFAVNKIDMAESCEGMGEEETRAYVADLVSQQLGVPGFHLDPQQVFLVSARDALFARLVLRAGGASQDALDTFRKLAFGKRWRSVTDPELIRETALEMEAASGLPALEAGLLGFCASRAAVLHLISIADSLEALLAQVHNLCSTSAASLHQGVAALSAQVGAAQLRRLGCPTTSSVVPLRQLPLPAIRALDPVEALSVRLADTLAAFESVQHEVAQIEALVVDEVRARLGRLQSKLEDQIGQVLTPGRPPLAAPQGRWPAAWSLVCTILRAGRGDAAASAEDSSEEELQMRLCELHSTIFLQIEEEVRAFWASLESATNARARQLFTAINARTGELCAAIEGEVSEALSCRLEPAELRLEPPTAEQFHADLQALFATGIQRRVEQEHEVVALPRTVFVRRQHHGLCDRFEYWAPVTETHRQLVEVERPRYSADLRNVRAYFTGMVQTTIRNSVRAVRAYVRSYLAGRLAEARRELGAYADRYRACMQEALDVARSGEAERGAALQVAEARCAAVAGLLDEVQELQGQAEEMLGDWREELLAAEAEPPAGPAGSPDPAGSSAPAAATVAALADLQGGNSGAGSRCSSACSAPPLMAESWLSAGGGLSAAEAAEAYAAQEAARELLLAAEAAAVADVGEEEEVWSAGAEAAVVEAAAAEVEVVEDACSLPQASRRGAAGSVEGAAASGGEEAAEAEGSEADWTVVSGAASDEEEERGEGATKAAKATGPPEAGAEADGSGSQAEPMVT